MDAGGTEQASPGRGIPGAIERAGASAAGGGVVWAFDEHRLTIARQTGERRTAANQLLSRVVAEASDTPAEDVELVGACAECGARHGAPRIEYPAAPSGAHWVGDAVAVGGVTVAAIRTGGAIGVAIGRAGPDLVRVDATAFHPAELERLRAVPDAERAALRGRMWVRKAAVARALGHRTFVEPARVELVEPEADVLGDRSGRSVLARGIPEFGADWARVLVLDVPVEVEPQPAGEGAASPPLAAAVALLP
ncbi:hypothetical protein [Agromyces sp. LHK192]|uniref:hypothetical protein n=1 Tax=Agromyces sp. LHK192 TaxID=2498704 RepID=UPI000FD6EF73|nr:hypothetical protein [Agromyces sp. LHK192]